tara:strand:+ start:88 stop:288 length:201 start_codon:yes stop_codon:yes gene_type:complete
MKIKNMAYWKAKNDDGYCAKCQMPMSKCGCKPSPIKKSTPCWDGYEMIGMKDKGGRQVPNCVPKKK